MEEEAGESEDEDDVPDDLVMAGMSFASVGSTSMPAAELEALVVAHGGEWVSGNSLGNGACITHLISSEAEARKAVGKRTIKFQAAVDAKKPIVSADYVFALSGTPLAAAITPPSPAVARAPPHRSAGSKRGVAEVINLDEDEDEAAAAAAVDLTKLKVVELRAELEERGLETSGKKAVLLARLQAGRTTRRITRRTTRSPSPPCVGAS